MSVAASVRDCASLSSLQKNQVVMYEASRVLQTGAPQMKGFRLALVPGPSRLSLGIMLVLLLIFLPGLYCDLGSVYYSTYEIVIPKCLTVKGREDPEHAKCTPGPCCNISCQFEACGHKCRPASGECDLPEYCDGNSDACPEDSYKQDGTTCAQDHYCTQGQCRDLDEQCLNIFGYPARSAPVDCYISMNSKGDRFGNCGHPTLDNPAYVQCEVDNMFCGKVICTNIRRVPSIKPQHTVIQVPYEDDWCWSMDMYSTTDIPDDGDVHSGTLCAPDKVCMSHSCTDHAVLNYDCNPAEMCSGKGVCNNLKHCHCDFGYAPPDCKTPGNGGSVDSGPAGLPSTEEPGGSGSGDTTSRPKHEEFFLDLMVLLLIILLIIILLIIIICAILACKRSAAEEPTEKGPEEAAEKPPEQEPEDAAPEEAAPEEAASEEAAPEEAAPEEAPSEEGSAEEESEP
ncbi:hypothetical protein HPG69_019314 [Diceros bicornis minor]|uniref:Uncharacterized protein n=1 Tax=Diceros bicornis minor TaxID=77932 RepID=A0A7J7FMJ7_DICBM|nr:hypothetical protein HPG69_019314 [Diceros bicornis minor]